MPSQQPLKGIELIDCAKANAKEGIEVAAYQCGYDKYTDVFMQDLRDACQQIGVSIESIEELIVEPPIVRQNLGIEVAPETPSEL